jgi:nicotinamide mononucleotide transporter
MSFFVFYGFTNLMKEIVFWLFVKNLAFCNVTAGCFNNINHPTPYICRVSALEISAVILALLYLLLASAQNRWCWPAGIASSLIYIFVCYASNLLIEAALQVFYAVAGIAGWFSWQHSTGKPEAFPRSWTRREATVFFLICTTLWLLTGFLFSRYTTTSQPWLDAGISVFSIGCTLLAVKKIIQNWPLWFVIDLAAAYLYFQRDLRLSALLYLLYCVLAVFGWIQWKKAR